MSTDPRLIEFIEDQLAELSVRTARMFGEYALYVDDKVVGFVCDDTLLFKHLPDVDGVPDDRLDRRSDPGHAYPGSKIYRAVHGDALEDRDWLSAIAQDVADSLPVPPPRKPRATAAAPPREPS